LDVVSEIDGVKRVLADTVVLPDRSVSAARTGTPERSPSYSRSIVPSEEGEPKYLDVEISRRDRVRA